MWISGLRTITETFSDLLTSLANQSLDSAIGEVETEQYPGFLSVFHEISSNNPMTFYALTRVPDNHDGESNHKEAANYIRPSEKTPRASLTRVELARPKLHILDKDGEDVPTKLQSYVEAMARKSYDEELSLFMQRTLALASELSLRKDVSKVLENHNHMPEGRLTPFD